MNNKPRRFRTILIIDSNASGRFICEVAVDGDKVVKASYVKNDRNYQDAQKTGDQILRGSLGRS